MKHGSVLLPPVTHPVTLRRPGHWTLPRHLTRNGLNASSAGIESSPAASIAASDWQVGTIEHFADKQAYVDNLKQWGGIFLDRFNHAFNAGQ